MIKQIQLTSPILLQTLDMTEMHVYLACENLNVYQVPINDLSQKKALTHKRKITAMTLSNCVNKLVSGDVNGLIYVWQLTTEDLALKTFELHKNKGAITNLVSCERPLSLFGLTANMQGYEPCQLKALQR